MQKERRHRIALSKVTSEISTFGDKGKEMHLDQRAEDKGQLFKFRLCDDSACILPSNGNPTTVHFEQDERTVPLTSILGKIASRDS